MSGEYSVVRSGRATAIVRTDFVASFEDHRLIGCAASPLLSVPGGDDPGAGGRRSLAGGRGGARVIEAGRLGEAVVRPYRRGGLIERFNERRYFLGNRAFEELIATHRLRLRGAPVPEALAAVQRSHPAGYTACMVTRRVPRTMSCAAALAEGSGARAAIVMEAMGRAVRGFHEAGGVHADLNAHNLLVSEEGDGPVIVIDLDRASVSAGPTAARPARSNLRRLRRSLLKLEMRVALDSWDAFERGYETPPDPLPAA
jgi:3-deoxy-D-manno-octulosonic acid kinase